jgi:ribonuclease-3
MRTLARPLQDAKTALQEWAQGRGLATPVYRLRDRKGPDHAPAFTVAVAIDGYAEATADGTSKRAAEQAAAAAFITREGLPSGAKR